MLILAAVASLALAPQTPYDAQAFPLPEQTVETIRHGLESYLLDAEGARFRGTRAPRSGTFIGGTDPTPRTGQILCVQINGKNAYGGYLGFRDYVVVIADDGAVYPTERMDRHMKNPWIVDRECDLPADPAES